MNRYIIDMVATIATRAGIAEERVQVLERENLRLKEEVDALRDYRVDESRRASRFKAALQAAGVKVPE
jgi:5-enolpyruvylshikimate-3-phosphate synthase